MADWPDHILTDDSVATREDILDRLIATDNFFDKFPNGRLEVGSGCVRGKRWNDDRE